uniref:N-acetylneuraminate lyase n=1 Tax=Tursiops truncatus TaxID=9739 RepID=A0A2U4CS25_TURTR|nr:N-acetylneuraminate lyase isoform X2 [Tursiops truncatus]
MFIQAPAFGGPLKKRELHLCLTLWERGATRGGAGRRYSPKAPGRGGHVVRGPGDKERGWEHGAERRRWTSGVWRNQLLSHWSVCGLSCRRTGSEEYLWLDQIVIHVGALSLKESQELAQHAAKIGADGIAVIAPFFLQPWNKDVLINFLKEVAAAAPALPFYYYHIPALTGVKIRAEELLDGIQDKIPTFQGLKFSDTDLLDFGQCVDQNRQQQFAFLFGVDEQLLSALVMGATGAVGSTYNYLGKKTNQMLEAFERKDFSSALNHQFCIQRFINFVVKLGFGVSQTKAIMTLVSGIPMGPPRLPLQKASREFTDNAEAKLKSLDFLSFTDLKDGNLEACS